MPIAELGRSRNVYTVPWSRTSLMADSANRESGTEDMKARAQQTRWPVIIASVALIVAAAAFGAVFYYYDGMAVVADLRGQLAAWTSRATPAPGPAGAADVLNLPKGMRDSFALGVWEEQIDSQSLIERMVEGEVVSLRIDDVRVEGRSATLTGEASFSDDTSAPGTIGLRKYGDIWYLAYISSRVGGDIAGGEKRDVASISDVDQQLLNTIMAEQAKGKEVTQGLVDGTITTIGFGEPKPGSNTVLIPLEMMSGAEKRYADLVAIRTQVEGDDMWFIARFNETGSNAGE